MPVQAGDAYIPIHPDLSGFERELDRGVRGKLGGAMAGVAGTLGRVGAAATVAGGAIAVKFGFDAVQAASNLNETLSKTEQVFGTATGQVTGFADRMAEAFGLPKQQILDAASNIGLVAKASGLSEDAAAGMSTEMAQLAADAASFFNVPLDEALEKIRSGLVGEAEPLRSFGVLLSEAAVKEEALALGIATAGEELSEQQKVQARASLIQKGMADASGDLERTQGSLANQTRKLQGKFANFSAEIGQRLLPVALDLVDWASKNMPRAMDAVRGAFDRARPTIDTISGVLSTVGDVVGGFVESFQAGGDEVEGTTSRIRGVIDQLRPTFDAAFGAIRSIVETVVSVLTDAWDRFGRGLVDNIGRQLRNVTMIVSGVFDVLRGLFTVITAVLTGDWSKAWDGIKAVVSGAWRAILGVVRGAIETVRAFVEIGMGVVSQAWAWAWDRIKNAASSAARFVTGKVSGVVDFFAGVPATLARVGSGIFDWLKNAFRSAINFVIRGWNRLEFRVPGFKVGPVGFDGFTLGMPDIPELAEGGIVTRPTLAMIGEAGPEAVVPLDRGFGATISIEHFHAPDTDPADVARELAWMMRTGGVSAGR